MPSVFVLSGHVQVHRVTDWLWKLSVAGPVKVTRSPTRGFCGSHVKPSSSAKAVMGSSISTNSAIRVISLIFLIPFICFSSFAARAPSGDPIKQRAEGCLSCLGRRQDKGYPLGAAFSFTKDAFRLP